MMDIANIIFWGLIIISIVILFYWEYTDEANLYPTPYCSYVTNYCANSALANDIKIIIKEPTNGTKVNLLLDELVNKPYEENIIFWRKSLLVSFIFALVFYIFNYFLNINLSLSIYLFLIIVNFTLIYWLLNHIQYHIRDPITNEKQFIADAIKTYINNNCKQT